jgi:hypothetical protein
MQGLHFPILHGAKCRINELAQQLCRSGHVGGDLKREEKKPDLSPAYKVFSAQKCGAITFQRGTAGYKHRRREEVSNDYCLQLRHICLLISLLSMRSGANLPCESCMALRVNTKTPMSKYSWVQDIF